MDDIDLWLLNTDAAQMMTLCRVPADEETTCLALTLQVASFSAGTGIPSYFWTNSCMSLFGFAALYLGQNLCLGLSTLYFKAFFNRL